MGRRGPKPAPTALKIASGVRADRVNADSPTALVAIPACPFELSPDAAAEWVFSRRIAGRGVVAMSYANAHTYAGIKNFDYDKANRYGYLDGLGALRDTPRTAETDVADRMIRLTNVMAVGGEGGREMAETGAQEGKLRVDVDRADAIRSAIIARFAIRGVSHGSIGRITGLSRSGVSARIARMSPAELRDLAAVDLDELAAVHLAAEPAPAG